MKPRPRISATTVVSSFLEALKNRDFESAYEKIHIFSSDLEGYVKRFELLYENYDISIVDYRILATQLFKDTAIVVAEVEVDYRKPGEKGRRSARYTNRYDLSIPQKEWKIVKDECIENCSQELQGGDGGG
ncbi:MAG: hypothetical protein OXF23_05625 [Candidatus Dadabacteria bacterium]|nr:hypothetical protein [Candidatus Dadabacteria bacterium]MCY4262333.1 hypothetical protein [Candidatus Dadabacteria bacterium]